MDNKIEWDLFSLAYFSRGLYFKIRIDDIKRRYTYIKWFMGHGKKIVSFKNAVLLFNRKIHTVIDASDKLAADCIIQAYVFENIINR